MKRAMRRMIAALICALMLGAVVSAAYTEATLDCTYITITSDGFVADTFCGVEARYNLTGPTYFCSELVERFYREVYVLNVITSDGTITVSGSKGLVFVRTDTPAPGDIAYASGPARGSAYNHYALVKSVDPARQTVTLFEQNWGWDGKAGTLTARRETRLGVHLLAQKPLSEVPEEEVLRVLAAAARKDGLSMFDFSDEVLSLQRRISAVSAWHPELEIPSVSTETLLAQADSWLPAFAGHARTGAALRKIDLSEVIWSLLPHELRQTVERLAPAQIEVPSGSRIRLDYRQGAEAPVLRVRLQECFGLLDTPRVDGGRVPVLMELLSPGYKPVQLTADLRSFWETAYFEVRKELRRRYPKHAWPDRPLDSAPVRGVKKKNGF